MGQLMHFYGGDPKVIVDALARRDRTLLDNSTVSTQFYQQESAELLSRLAHAVLRR